MNAIQSLSELPTRTLGRPVGAIMKSARGNDQCIADLIVTVRYNSDAKTDWSHTEAVAVERELEACPVTLRDFIAQQGGAA